MCFNLQTSAAALLFSVISICQQMVTKFSDICSTSDFAKENWNERNVVKNKKD